MEVSEEDEQLSFTITLKNKGEEDIDLPISSGQKYEIVVFNETGEEVYRYSDDKFFTLALLSEKIKAGSEIKWLEVWDMKKEGKRIPAGEYRVEAEVLVQVEETNLLIEPDQLKASQLFTLAEEQDEPVESDDPVKKKEPEQSPHKSEQETSSNQPEKSSNQKDQNNEEKQNQQLEQKKEEPQTEQQKNVEEFEAENHAFRQLKVEGSQGEYIVRGEARVFEATFQYAVSDGHVYLLEDFMTVGEGAPAWSAFTLQLSIPKADLPMYGTLMLELFEESAQDGTRVNEIAIPLERLIP